MIAYGAQQMADLLGLTLKPTKQVTFCPFHKNTDTPALSVDFSKGQFFCHGGCEEPKGGGPIRFMQKWAKAKTGDEITRDEARRRLNRAFVVPDATTLRRRIMDERVDLFVWAMHAYVPERLRQLERMTSLVRCEPTPKLWDELARLYRALSWFESAWSALLESHSREDIVTLMKDAQQQSIWTNEIEIEAREHRTRMEEWHASKDYQEFVALAREERERVSKEMTCRSTSTETRSKRQPVPRRQPVTRRQPI